MSKTQFIVLVLAMFVIGVGGVYLRSVQERIIETQATHTKAISQLETQEVQSLKYDEIKIDKLDKIIGLLTKQNQITGNVHKQGTVMHEELRKTNKQIEKGLEIIKKAEPQTTPAPKPLPTPEPTKRSWWRIDGT